MSPERMTFLYIMAVTFIMVFAVAWIIYNNRK